MTQCKKLNRELWLYWLQMTVMCGAVSFVYGFQATQGDVIPMLVGMLSFSWLLAWADSRQKTQTFVTRHPHFLRIFHTLLKIHIVCEAIALVLINFEPAQVFLIGYWLIGLASLALIGAFTNIDIVGKYSTLSTYNISNLDLSAQTFDYHASVWLTTLTTGLIHIIIVIGLAAVLAIIRKIFRAIFPIKTMEVTNALD